MYPGIQDELEALERLWLVQTLNGDDAGSKRFVVSGLLYVWLYK